MIYINCTLYTLHMYIHMYSIHTMYMYMYMYIYIHVHVGTGTIHVYIVHVHVYTCIHVGTYRYCTDVQLTVLRNFWKSLSSIFTF